MLFIRWQEASQKEHKKQLDRAKMTSGRKMQKNDENVKESKKGNRAMTRKMR